MNWTIHLEVRKDCNQKCKTCNKGFGTGSLQEGVVSALLAKTKVDKLVLVGGEPSKNTDILSILEKEILESNQRPEIEVVSNFVCYKGVWWKRMAKLIQNTGCKLSVTLKITKADNTTHIKDRVVLLLKKLGVNIETNTAYCRYIINDGRTMNNTYIAPVQRIDALHDAIKQLKRNIAYVTTDGYYIVGSQWSFKRQELMKQYSVEMSADHMAQQFEVAGYKAMLKAIELNAHSIVKTSLEV